MSRECLDFNGLEHAQNLSTNILLDISTASSLPTVPIQAESQHSLSSFGSKIQPENVNDLSVAVASVAMVEKHPQQELQAKIIIKSSSKHFDENVQLSSEIVPKRILNCRPPSSFIKVRTFNPADTPLNLPLSLEATSLSSRLKASIMVPNTRNIMSKLYAHSKATSINDKAAFNNDIFQPFLANRSEVNDESTIFDDMTMDNILDYMLSTKVEDDDKKGPLFLYVTPRFYIEDVVRMNFYDLVAIDKPGRRISNMKSLQMQYGLSSKQLMILSLHGILIDHSDNMDGDDDAEFIPILQFMKEKQQLEFLRSGRFFGNFQELKAFCAWRKFTRRERHRRATKALSEYSFFAESELIQAQQSITELCFHMEANVELFYFHGKGSINIADFLDRQMEHVETIKERLSKMHLQLGDTIYGQYVTYAAGAKLENSIAAVKKIHPRKDAMKATIAEDDSLKEQEWYQLRSIQRVSMAFKEKLTKLFILAQFKFDYTIAVVLEKFWLRFKQFISGVPLLKDNAVNYWELDRSKFDNKGRPVSSFFTFQDGDKILEDDVVGEAVKMIFEDEIDESKNSNNIEATEKTNELIKLAFSLMDRRDNDVDSKVKVMKSNRMKHIFNGMKIQNGWEDAGSHANVSVNISSNRTSALTMSEMMSLNSLNGLSVIITPSKDSLMSNMHALCGCIGSLIENLPNMRRHPFICNSLLTTAVPNKEELPELGIGITGADDVTDENISKSSKYFTCLIVHPIFNSTEAYNLAVECLNLARNAYFEACVLDSFTFKLLEVMKKLWFLSPNVIAKQIERSLVLAKVKDFLDNPGSLDDITRLNARDTSRIVAIRNTATYLDESIQILSSIKNIKFPLGLIASFDPILSQLRFYRAMQEKTFYERLPTSFTSRSKIFYDTLQVMEKMFSSRGTGLEELVMLLKRLKNFEKSKEPFHSEIEACETMFNVIRNHKKLSHNGSDTILKDLEAIKSTISRRRTLLQQERIDPSRMHQALMDGIERLMACMNRARSLLLSQIQVQ